jgi:hypothetical protein
MKVPHGREFLIVAAVLLVAAQWLHSKQDTEDTKALEELLANRNNDLKGAQVALAGKDAQIADLKRLHETAALLGGPSAKAIAGFAINVARHDTVVVHDTVATTVLADSTRVAHFRDSTFAGVFSATITAPPFPAALSVVDSIERPAFRPEVGFIKIGSKYVAAVAWQGEKVEIEAPFFNPDPVKPKTKRVVRWVEGTYNLVGSPELRAGVALNLFGLQLGPSVAQRIQLGERTTLGVTFRKEF